MGSKIVSDSESAGVNLNGESSIVGQERSTSSSSNMDDDSRDDNGEVYYVERIYNKKVVRGTAYYLIKWKGWPESSNTWEPLENLNGCAELMEEFETTYALKRKKHWASGSGRGSQSFSNEEKDTDKVIQETQPNMKSYVILPEWPVHYEALSVEGVIHVDGVLNYVVQRKARLSSKKLDGYNAVVVSAESFKKSHPQLVIDFYSSRVLWNENAKDNEEQARIAAQVSQFYHRRGQVIADDIARQSQEDVKQSEKPTDKAPEGGDVGMRLDGQMGTDSLGLSEDEIETDVSSCSTLEPEVETANVSE